MLCVGKVKGGGGGGGANALRQTADCGNIARLLSLALAPPVSSEARQLGSAGCCRQLSAHCNAPLKGPGSDLGRLEVAEQGAVRRLLVMVR